jgi:toxin FitB
VILLDTCVISEFARPAPDPAVVAWMATVPDAALRISALTVGEIHKGAELLEPGPRRDRVEAWLSSLHATYADRILPVDTRVAAAWGRLRRTGRPPIDSLLAATALCHGLHLATRNVRDFDGTGVLLINPWEHPPL